MTTTIFAYGTLRTGEPHWARLLAPADGVRAVTEAAFTMRTLGRFPIVERGGLTAIAGELFELESETLAVVDELEGHPRWYERAQISVRLASGQSQRTWIYLMPPGRHDDSPIIASGDWLRRC
ncbi:MAG: gamma-glutamylcyclotransferase [Planctomycetes bacterium]|jgi:gamma-glutamylcyclotransferase (GGCT)/AIG2-like uncharacterized protein YtfP|nr:gamma-glutamylcyclotransferase [Planctomycetota bacterium]